VAARHSSSIRTKVPTRPRGAPLRWGYVKGPQCRRDPALPDSRVAAL
jgi:hypothetical protein